MEKINFIIALPMNFGAKQKDDIKKTFESITSNKVLAKCPITVVGTKNGLSVAEETFGEIKTKCTLSKIEVKGQYGNLIKPINEGAMNCKTPFFCVLRPGCEITQNWPKNFSEFQAEEKGAIAYIPICEGVDKNGNVTAFVNEIAWANSYVNEMGYIDGDCIETYVEFLLQGAFLKTEAFISLGKLKESMKIAATYEFLLRACYNNKTLYVVPKIGYRFPIEDSLIEGEEVLDPKEVEWLVGMAKQEYTSNEDHDIKYVESVDNNSEKQ